MTRIPLKTRKEYLATIPWVTILSKSVACTGWHNKSWGRKKCPNPAYYSFKHHKGRANQKPWTCDHTGQREYYCWSHLVSRGLYGDMCEEARTDRWMKKNPPPWPIEPRLCLVMDKSDEHIYGICNLEMHGGAVHRETLPNGTIWAEWRSVSLQDELTRAEEYITPEQREVQDVQD